MILKAYDTVIGNFSGRFQLFFHSPVIGLKRGSDKNPGSPPPGSGGGRNNTDAAVCSHSACQTGRLIPTPIPPCITGILASKSPIFNPVPILHSISKKSRRICFYTENFFSGSRNAAAPFYNFLHFSESLITLELPVSSSDIPSTFFPKIPAFSASYRLDRSSRLSLHAGNIFRNHLFDNAQFQQIFCCDLHDFCSFFGLFAVFSREWKQSLPEREWE